MSHDFYRAFEERHRGTRELIKSRQRVYLPFIQPLLSLYEAAKAIDLGCGRGEWLELLKESGFDGHGVDLDDGMLAACRELGLSVTTQDAISALKSLPDESQVIVSGFHLAEHIQIDDLHLLVREALRVLKPAGILILETPNPENITVGTVNFYLDPTHQKPIPPLLLSFLPEYHGFSKVKVIRLQEDKSLTEKKWISLHDVLGGVSPDYAVVAQKAAGSILLERTVDAFSKEYGFTLDTLTKKFDQQAMQASARAASAEAQAMQASARAASAEAQAMQASERAINATYALAAVHNSSSWRITAPLRMASRVIRALTHAPKGLNLSIKTKAKLLVIRTGRYINRRPKIKKIALGVLSRIPALKAHLKATTTISSFAQRAEPNISADILNLTPRARQIYVELNDAINRQQRKNG
jgi:O-antigen chain-terminating methyltransferase